MLVVSLVSAAGLAFFGWLGAFLGGARVLVGTLRVLIGGIIALGATYAIGYGFAYAGA
jgi:hypothetical protein